jgi:pimeloyl-ACP methyl ester carboxylesterase
MEEMAQRRKNSRLVVVDAGHVMHEDNVAATARVIDEFLTETACPI